MKKLITILTLSLLLFSCKKEIIQIEDKQVESKLHNYIFDAVQKGKPGSSASISTFTFARAEYSLPAHGFKTTADVKRLGSNSGTFFFIAGKFLNIWIQIGYDNKGRYMFQHYDAVGPVVLDDLIIINNTPIINMNQKNTFAIRNIEGTTRWVTLINDLPVISFEGHTDVCHTIDVGIEYENQNRFPELNLYPAVELWNDGNWIQPTGLYQSFRGKFGQEGQLQHPPLRANEVNQGGNIPAISFFWLWNTNL